MDQGTVSLSPHFKSDRNCLMDDGREGVLVYAVMLTVHVAVTGPACTTPVLERGGDKSKNRKLSLPSC